MDEIKIITITKALEKYSFIDLIEDVIRSYSSDL